MSSESTWLEAGLQPTPQHRAVGSVMRISWICSPSADLVPISDDFVSPAASGEPRSRECFESLIALWLISHTRPLEAPGLFVVLVLDLGCSGEILTPQATPRLTESQTQGLEPRHRGSLEFLSGSCVRPGLTTTVQERGVP